MDCDQLKKLEQTIRDIDDVHVEKLMKYLERSDSTLETFFDSSLGKISASILSPCERSLSELDTKEGSENVSGALCTA